jgi:pimeloyl-ACP methyl ester carboxylesterase
MTAAFGAAPVAAALVAAASAAALLVLMTSWRFARWWCRPVRVASKRTPEAYGMRFEEIAFSGGAATLRGWFVPPIGASAPAVIVAHAWSCNAGMMLPLARRLHQSGFGVLLFDARGHGASDGGGFVTIMTLAQDLLAAVDLAQRRPDVDPVAIGLLGHSMGGASAIVAASLDPRIRAVASLASFADNTTLTVAALALRRLPRRPFLPAVRLFIERALGHSMDWASPQARIGDLGVPILLVHGEADTFVSPSVLEELDRRSGRKAVRLLLAGRGHFDVLRDPRCGDAVGRFFQVALMAVDVAVPFDQRPASPSGRPPAKRARARAGRGGLAAGAAHEGPPPGRSPGQPVSPGARPHERAR